MAKRKDSRVPGRIGSHHIITPACRRNRGTDGALDEAVARLRRDYRTAVRNWGDRARFRLVLAIEPIEFGPGERVHAPDTPPLPVVFKSASDFVCALACWLDATGAQIYTYNLTDTPQGCASLESDSTPHRLWLNAYNDGHIDVLIDSATGGTVRMGHAEDGEEPLFWRPREEEALV